MTFPPGWRTFQQQQQQQQEPEPEPVGWLTVAARGLVLGGLVALSVAVLAIILLGALRLIILLWP